MMARSSSFTLVLLVAGLAVNAAAACAEGESIDSGFENLTGSGGAGTATGAGGATQTSVTSGPTTSTGSSSPTTATGSGSTSSGSGGAGGMTGCIDNGPSEPNDGNEASAFNLGLVDDDDDKGGMLSGTIKPGDVDWYTYQGDDTFPGLVDPTREFSSSETLRICKYMQCPDNDENFDCPGGSIDDTSPDGRKGCCGTVGFEVDFKCGSSSLNDDSADVWIRVDDPTGQVECASYTLLYHF